MALNNNLPYRQSIRMRNYDYRQPGIYFITICTRQREHLFGEIVDGRMHLNAAGRLVQSLWDAIPAHFPHVHLDEYVVMPDHFHGIIHIVGAAPCGRPVYENDDDPVYENHDDPAYENHDDPVYENDDDPVYENHDDPAYENHDDLVYKNHDHSAYKNHDDLVYKNHDHSAYKNNTEQVYDPMQYDSGRPQGAAPTCLSLSDVVHRFKSLTTNRYGNGVISQGWTPYSGRLWQRNYWERIIRNDTELQAIRRYIQNNPAQ